MLPGKVYETLGNEILELIFNNIIKRSSIVYVKIYMMYVSYLMYILGFMEPSSIYSFLHNSGIYTALNIETFQTV